MSPVVGYVVRVASDEGRPAADRILDAVVTMLESGGPDAVNVQEVARVACVSLTTVYRGFDSRDTLIAAAVAQWMDANVYRHLAVDLDAPIEQALCEHYRRIFEPWERTPNMAEAFVRARMSPAGDRLVDQGFAAVEPIVKSVLDGTDPDVAEDIRMILSNVVYALFVRYAAGEIAVTDVLPALERTVRRVVGPLEGRPGMAG